MDGELWHGQAQNGVNFYFGVQFDLEGHDQSSHKTIGILTKVFYIPGQNLVILAWTGDELSRGQAHDYRTHGRTSVLHIWYKYQGKLDAPHSAPTYLCSHLLAVIFLDQ